MRKASLVVIVIVLVIGTMGWVGAQGDTSPEAVVQSLVDRGYLTSAEGSLSFQQASAELRSKKSNGWTFGPLDSAEHTDFVLSATLARGTDDPGDACGLALRFHDDQHLYFVSLSGDGTVTFRGIYKRRGNPQEAVTPAATGPDRLTVIATGNTFQVLVNDVYVGLFEDPASLKNESGAIGLVSVSAASSDASFCTASDLWVWDLGAGAGSGPLAALPVVLPTSTPRPTAIPQPTATPRPAAGGRPPAATRTPPPTQAPVVAQLTAYDQPINDAVAELVSLGIIPAGGSEIFREPYAYFEGTGYWFTPLASYRPFTQIVMAVELTYTEGSSTETEFCGMLARAVVEGSGTDTFLNVGFTNDGSLVVVDVVDNAPVTFEIAASHVNLSLPHHVLFTALRDKIAVYLDGILVADDITVDERAGTYGVSLIGSGAQARCEGRNIWAWEVDDVVSFGGQCGVRAANTVNLRSGPGTGYDLAGSLTAGETALVVGQATGGDGFTWWKLESGAWVRSDVISVGGACSAVPVVEP